MQYKLRSQTQNSKLNFKMFVCSVFAYNMAETRGNLFDPFAGMCRCVVVTENNFRFFIFPDKISNRMFVRGARLQAVDIVTRGDGATVAVYI